MAGIGKGQKHPLILRLKSVKKPIKHAYLILRISNNPCQL